MRNRVYRVITHQDLGVLEREVNRVIQEGGELIGGIACVRDGGLIIWSQAVMCWY
jgi:hypothetical protein